MKERPILFSAPMVRALFAGTKTVTRRIVKPQPEPNEHARATAPESHRYHWPSHLARSMVDVRDMGSIGPYGAKGDRLWVKETHAFMCLNPIEFLYGPLKSLGIRAYGGAEPTPGCHLRVRSTDAMVAYAAHPTSYDDLPNWPGYTTYRPRTPEKWRPSIFMPRWASRITLEVVSVRVERLHEIDDADALREGVRGGSLTSDAEAFAQLWCEINGDESWNANPFVWRVEFKRIGQAQSEAA